MRDVVIVGYLRTAQSRSRPTDPGRDWFHKLRADELLGALLPKLVEKVGIDPKEIDDFLVGSAMGVSEQWSYGGRTPIILADLPDTISAKFVDQQCGSAMAGLQIGFMEIAQGFADTVMVGGMEHMTRIPMGGSTMERGIIAPNMALYLDPKYSHWDMMTAFNMGLTAEKLFGMNDNISVDDMNEWAVRSHQLAAKAQKEGFFDGEILPVEAEQADGTTMTVTVDQAVRGETTLEDLQGLRPAFKKDGVITAGVSSPLNAAATSVMMMSKDKAKELGLKPLATIRSIGFAGVDPTIMGEGPVPATEKALAHLDMKPQDIDYWEINEAFAIVVLNCANKLGIDLDKINVKGGGLAIGHPLGATGNRLVGTLARILNEKDARWGCANACCGGGQGVAMIIEREDY